LSEKQLEKLEKENEQLKKKLKEYEEREKIREIAKKLNLKNHIKSNFVLKKYIKGKFVEEDLNTINSDKIMEYFSNHTYFFGVDLFKVIKEYGWELLEKTFIEVYNKILKEKEKGETYE